MPTPLPSIARYIDEQRVDRSPATPPRMPGRPVIRNEMTDERFDESRTLMMDPDAFMQMREHMRRNPESEGWAAIPPGILGLLLARQS